MYWESNGSVGAEDHCTDEGFTVPILEARTAGFVLLQGHFVDNQGLQTNREIHFFV